MSGEKYRHDAFRNIGSITYRYQDPGIAFNASLFRLGMQAISYNKDHKDYPAYPISSPSSSPGLISGFIANLAPCAPKAPTVQSLEKNFAAAFKTVYQDDVFDPAVVVAEALAYVAISPMQNSKSIHVWCQCPLVTNIGVAGQGVCA